MAKITRIAARRDGFRRAGMAHSATQVDHPPGTFTDDQMKQLLDEPQLIVTVLDAPEPAADGKAQGGKSTGTEKK